MENLKDHYVGPQGRYPGGKIDVEDNRMDVYDKDGRWVVSIRKNGAGQWVDKSEACGLPGRHSLSPRGKEYTPGDKEHGGAQHQYESKN